MFESATLKLTGWYLLILMAISLVFSAVIYQITSNEINTRLDRLSSRILDTSGLLLAPSNNLGDIRSKQESEAANSLLISLIYANGVILLGGGVGSYLLARRTLAPIEAAHEAQSRFVSDASHELRTPLAAMKTELEVALMDASATKSELREILTSNLEEVEKLSSLSEMLLNLSRLDAKELDKTTIDLKKAAQTSIKRFGNLASRITLEGPKSVRIHGNTAAIEELITILVDNALKYSTPGSVIQARVYQKNHGGYFEISNTGKPISDEHLPHIFERFYRADSSRTSQTSSKGYGLGLSLAKKIADLHHSEITATSSSEGVTQFIVNLPLAKTASKN